MKTGRVTGLSWGFAAASLILGIVLVYAERQGDAVYAFLIGAVAGIIAVVLTTLQRRPAPTASAEDAEEVPRR